ncbi:AAA family ATPase [Alteribacillus sp. JSM 102045]|uniref:ATP-binding protein n=1 Tax=Alteribacillus sp. JSM 102045 TaxID=1562101 RepID=UPI0035C1238C
MNIEKIYIYGFGKFKDYAIPLQPSIQFIEGVNEAGKSTLRAFIQAVLFGFPTKKEKLLRYEPKTGGSYGGYLTIKLQTQETVTIERVMRKKASGDVTVYMENGEKLGEEWLLDFLGNMDRSIFQGIFCFGLEGLSEIDQLKGEALNRYIYEAGMTGTKQVFKMEQEIEEEMADLFKPKGKKPIINKNIKELNNQRLELREWEREFNRYGTLLLEEKQVEQDIELVQKEKKRILKEKEHFQRKQTLLQSLQETIEIDRKLKVLEPYERIPLEAEEKWNHFNKKRKEAEEGLAEINVHIQQLESKHMGSSVKWRIIKAKDDIYSIKEKVPLYRKYVEDIKRLDFSIENKQEKARDRLARFGISSEEDLTACETTLYAEEELHTLTERGKQLKERLRLLEEQIRQQKSKLVLMENDLAELNKQYRTKEERSQSEEIVFNYEYSKKMEASSANPSNNIKLALQISAIILFTLGIWEILTGNWLFGLLLLGTGSAVLIFRTHKRKGHGSSNVIENTTYYAHKQLLEEDKRTEAAIKEQKWQINREENIYDSLGEALENTEKEREALEKNLEEWCERYQFPFIKNIDLAENFFHVIREWKELIEEMSELNHEIKIKRKDMEEIKTEVYETAHIAGFPFAENDIEEIAAELWKFCQKAQHDNDTSWKEAERVEAVFEQKQYLLKMKAQSLSSIRELYETANSDNQESFLHAINEKKQCIEYKKQKNWLERQVSAQLLPGETIDKMLNELHSDHTPPYEMTEQLNIDLDHLDKKEKELFQYHAEIIQEIKKIEEGGTYEEKLQQFEENKGIFQDKLHKWLVLKTSKKLIEQAKAVYEQERQPQVIQKASNYFTYMTNEKYKRLFAPVGEEKFMVENTEGIRFSPEELSRGTAEQLYLSLRLALAEAYTQHEVFPLIMDDPFVNFDQSRQQAAFSLLLSASHQRQIIYFTCEQPNSKVLTDCAVTRLMEK